MILQFGSTASTYAMSHIQFHAGYIPRENYDGTVNRFYGYSEQHVQMGGYSTEYTNLFSDFTYQRLAYESLEAHLNKNTNANKNGERIGFDNSNILVFGYTAYCEYYYYNYGETGKFMGICAPLPEITFTAGTSNNSKYFFIDGQALGLVVLPTGTPYTMEAEYNMTADTISLYVNNTLIGQKTSAGISALTGYLTGTSAYMQVQIGYNPRGLNWYVLDDRGPAPFNARLGTWDVAELRPISSTTDGNWQYTADTLEDSLIPISDANVLDRDNEISTDIIDSECTFTFESIPSKYAVGAVSVNCGARNDTGGGAVIDQELYINGTEVDDCVITVEQGLSGKIANVHTSYNNTEGVTLPAITDITLKLKHPSHITP